MKYIPMTSRFKPGIPMEATYSSSRYAQVRTIQAEQFKAKKKEEELKRRKYYEWLVAGHQVVEVIKAL